MTKYSMKRLLLMTMLCCGLTAIAQNEKGTFSIKPLVGVNMTTLPGGLSDDYYHNKFGLTAGVEAEYGVKSNIEGTGTLLQASFCCSGTYKES